MTGFEKVDDRTIDARIQNAHALLAVDFTAAWCPPCRVFSPVLRKVAAEFGSELEVVELDTDESPAAAGRFGVRGMPTVIFFRNGVEVDRSVGAMPEVAIRRRVASNL